MRTVTEIIKELETRYPDANIYQLLMELAVHVKDLENKMVKVLAESK